jgi:hypothetical protein
VCLASTEKARRRLGSNREAEQRMALVTLRFDNVPVPNDKKKARATRRRSTSRAPRRQARTSTPRRQP